MPTNLHKTTMHTPPIAFCVNSLELFDYITRFEWAKKPDNKRLPAQKVISQVRLALKTIICHLVDILLQAHLIENIYTNCQSTLQMWRYRSAGASHSTTKTLQRIYVLRRMATTLARLSKSNADGGDITRELCDLNLNQFLRHIHIQVKRQRYL